MLMFGATNSLAASDPGTPTSLKKMRDCLNSMPMESDEYMKMGDTHFLFKSRLAGLSFQTKSNTGVFVITPTATQFCELKFVPKTNFEFDYNGLTISKKHSQATSEKSAKIGSPTKCIDVPADADAQFTNQVEGYLKRKAQETTLKKADLIKQHFSAACMKFPRAQQKINEGIADRNSGGSSSGGATGGSANGGNSSGGSTNIEDN